MRKSAASAFLLLVISCGGQPEVSDVDGRWVGTITTEGDVTTVVNESGSIWGGPARLVEEASIGVETGPPEYMLGQIAALHMTDDEIYLVDGSVSMVRVYDLEGNHLRSFGGAGQGPGELSDFIYGVAEGPDGRVYVGDFSNRRINIYTHEGETLDSIPLSSQVGCCQVPLVLDEDGVWTQVWLPGPEGEARRDAVQVFALDGPVGEPTVVPEIEYPRLFVELRGRRVENVPFAPRFIWEMTYDGGLVAGASHRYELRFLRPDGSTTVVRRFWDPVPVSTAEADWRRRYALAAADPDGSATWSGDSIPDHKPAFVALLPSPTGETWVIREGAGSAQGCGISPQELVETRDVTLLQQCMYPEMLIDVFDGDGRYLGEVEGLPSILGEPFFYGDGVLVPEQDEDGTLMVKRYRLQLPPPE